MRLDRIEQQEQQKTEIERQKAEHDLAERRRQEDRALAEQRLQIEKELQLEQMKLMASTFAEIIKDVCKK